MIAKEELRAETILEEKNRLFEPLVIIIITLLLLMIVSFIPADTELQGIKIRSVDIISDIKPD